MKKYIEIIYKILIIIMCGIGLYMNFELFSLKESIIYFTIQSNLLCFVYYIIIVILMLIKKLKKNNFYYISKGMVTMAITLTFLMYQLVIHPNGGVPGYENNMLACHFVHLFVPLMIIFDYIIFGEKGNLKKNYPLYWSMPLLFYLAFVIIYTLCDGTFMNGESYPYIFMDINKFGLIGVVRNLLIIYVFFVGYGTIVQKIDNWLKKEIK